MIPNTKIPHIFIFTILATLISACSPASGTAGIETDIPAQASPTEAAVVIETANSPEPATEIPSPTPAAAEPAETQPPEAPTPWPEQDLPQLGRVDAPPANGCVVYQNGRVTDEELPYIYSGPGLQHTVIGQLARNRWADGIQASNGWYEIVAGPGQTGWVQQSGKVGVSQGCDFAGPIRIQFPAGATATTINGAIGGQGQVEYLFWGAAGQDMEIIVSSPQNSILFHVAGVSDGQVIKHLLDGHSNWQGTLPTSQDYLMTLDNSDIAATYTIRLSIETPAPQPIPDHPTLGSADAPPANACVIYQNGLVTDQELPFVYAGPAVQYAVEGQLGRNRWAYGLQVENGWYEIIIGPGRTGWIQITDKVGVSQGCGMSGPIRIQFPAGATTTTINGQFSMQSQVEYLFWAAQGQYMEITVTSPENTVLFHIAGAGDGQVIKHLLDGNSSWQGTLPASQDYLLTLDSSDTTASYTIYLAID